MADRRCKHCGKEVIEVPYGAGWRWEHLSLIAGVRTSGGPWCQRSKAEPEEG